MKILNFPFGASLPLLFLCANHAFGQTNFIENSFPVKNTTHATAIPGGWAVPMNSSDCSRNWIVKYNASTGTNRKFSEADSVGTPVFRVQDIIQSQDGGIICGGLSGLGEDVANYVSPYIFKMNSTGNIQWQTTFSDSLHRSLGGSSFNRIVVSPTGDIYGLSGNFLGKTDSLGHIRWMKPILGITDIAWTSKGLTAAYNNGLTLIDTSGSAIKIYYGLSGSPITALENGTNGSFYAMNVNNIYRLDSTFKVTDSMHFTGYGTGVVTPPIINYADDSGYYFAHANSLKAFDISGNLKWTSYLPSNCIISGLATGGNMLAVTGKSDVSGFIKTYDINGNKAPMTRDVEIIKLNPIKVSMHPSGYNFYNVTSNMNVTVQNKGNEIIDSFYLASLGPLSGPYYFCSDEYLQSFHHLNLAPGDTTTLNITFGRTWEAPPGNPYPLNVTMYATSPNGKLNLSETNPAGNYSTTVLGINENQSKISGINIYPNPATNILHIENNTGLNTSISLSDITGKELMIISNSKNQLEMDISTFPAGIYFLKASNENGIQVEKIIKD